MCYFTFALLFHNWAGVACFFLKMTNVIFLGMLYLLNDKCYIFLLYVFPKGKWISLRIHAYIVVNKC